MDRQDDGAYGDKGNGVGMTEGLLHIEAVETVTGLEGAWVRVKDHGWTIATTNYLAANLSYDSKQCIEWVHRWVVQCHLPVLPADATPPDYVRTATAPITDPLALTVAILENEMDSKMVGFLITAIHQGAQTAFTMSPFALRVLSDGTDKQQAEHDATKAKGPSKRRRKSRSAP